MCSSPNNLQTRACLQLRSASPTDNTTPTTPAHHGEDQVHRADVLVVGRIHETAPPGRGVVRVIVMRVITVCVVVCAVSRCHRQTLRRCVIAR